MGVKFTDVEINDALKTHIPFSCSVTSRL